MDSATGKFLVDERYFVARESSIVTDWTKYVTSNYLLAGYVNDSYGKKVAAKGSLINVSYYDTGKQEKTTIDAHGCDIHAYCVTPNGNVVTALSDCSIRVWDSITGQELAVCKGNKGLVMALGVMPDGKILAASQDKMIHIWDSTTGQQLAVCKGHTTYVSRVCVVPDGKIISGSYDKTIRIWDSTTGQQLAVCKGHTDLVKKLVITSHGLIVSASDDNTIRMWDGSVSLPMNAYQAQKNMVVSTTTY